MSHEFATVEFFLSYQNERYLSMDIRTHIALLEKHSMMAFTDEYIKDYIYNRGDTKNPFDVARRKCNQFWYSFVREASCYDEDVIYGPDEPWAKRAQKYLESCEPYEIAYHHSRRRAGKYMDWARHGTFKHLSKRFTPCHLLNMDTEKRASKIADEMYRNMEC